MVSFKISFYNNFKYSLIFYKTYLIQLHMIQPVDFKLTPTFTELKQNTRSLFPNRPGLQLIRKLILVNFSPRLIAWIYKSVILSWPEKSESMGSEVRSEARGAEIYGFVVILSEDEHVIYNELCNTLVTTRSVYTMRFVLLTLFVTTLESLLWTL